MRIALLGDMALTGRYDKTLHDDVEKKLKVLREIISSADYVVANLEAPLTGKSSTLQCKGVYLKTDPINVETLVWLGVTHVTIANNHIHDYGNRGANETIKTLNKAGIEYVGLGKHPKLLEKGEDRALLEGFCCLSANAVKYGTNDKSVQELTYAGMNNFLSLAKKENALPIASVHYGIEGLHYPSIEHLRLFRHFTNEYDYVLHGNHPHTVQGIEEKNCSLLVYSQGNLCFGEVMKTSIHSIPKEGKESHKSIVVLVDVTQNQITGYEVFGITDLDPSSLHESDDVRTEFERYSSVLAQSESEINDLRVQEIRAQNSNAPAHNAAFFRNRLNYRYIGAYINGRRHAKKYRKFINIIEKECKDD